MSAVSPTSICQPSAIAEPGPTLSGQQRRQVNEIVDLIEVYIPIDKVGDIRNDLEALILDTLYRNVEELVRKINSAIVTVGREQACSLQLERTAPSFLTGKSEYKLVVDCSILASEHKQEYELSIVSPKSVEECLSQELAYVQRSNVSLVKEAEKQEDALINMERKKAFLGEITAYLECDRHVVTEVLVPFCHPPELQELIGVYHKLAQLHEQFEGKAALPVFIERISIEPNEFQYTLALRQKSSSTKVLYCGRVCSKDKVTEPYVQIGNPDLVFEHSKKEPNISSEETATLSSFNSITRQLVSQVDERQANKERDQWGLAGESRAYFESAVVDRFSQIVTSEQVHNILSQLTIPVTHQMLMDVCEELISITLDNHREVAQTIFWVTTEVNLKDKTATHRLIFKDPKYPNQRFQLGKVVIPQHGEKPKQLALDASELPEPVYELLVEGNGEKVTETLTPKRNIWQYAAERAPNQPQKDLQAQSENRRRDFSLSAVKGQTAIQTALRYGDRHNSSETAHFRREADTFTSPSLPQTSESMPYSEKINPEPTLPIQSCPEDMHEDSSSIYNQFVYATDDSETQAVFEKFEGVVNLKSDYLEDVFGTLGSEINVREFCRDFFMLKGKSGFTKEQIRLDFEEGNNTIHLQVYVTSLNTWKNYKTYKGRTFNISIADASRLIEQ
ncbi:hypothetical protein SOPP22_00190 [Shewanella sp. OPT22]|nr:hypothetical protein SOPP22_00190 [Shewanella sp. OPT22]